MSQLFEEVKGILTLIDHVPVSSALVTFSLVLPNGYSHAVSNTDGSVIQPVYSQLTADTGFYDLNLPITSDMSPSGCEWQVTITPVASFPPFIVDQYSLSTSGGSVVNDYFEIVMEIQSTKLSYAYSVNSIVNAIEGDGYINTSTLKQYLFSGGTWIQISSGGTGTVNPGVQRALTLYPESGTNSVVGPSSGLTTSFLVPGEGIVSTLEYVFPSGSLASQALPSEIANMVSESDYFGSGVDLGSPWTVVHGHESTMNVNIRGIGQNSVAVLNKNAIGDTAGLYYYVNSYGGITAGSDEGVTGITVQSIEPNGFYEGTITSTTGVGDKNPVISASGQVPGDGSYLIDISKVIISLGDLALQSTSSELTLTNSSGTISIPWLYQFTLNGDPPLTTAVGVVSAAIPQSGFTRDDPQSITITVTLYENGAGESLSFVEGDVVSVAGNQFCEQSILDTVVDNGDGTNTLTLKLANPNSEAVIFQGGIQGCFMEFIADTTRNSQISTYPVFGSLGVANLVYACYIKGGSVGNQLPFVSISAQSTSGANSFINLYPGAEIVSKQDANYSITLEPNGVDWTDGDSIAAPHYVIGGGNTMWSVTSRNSLSTDWSGVRVTVGGPGAAGGAFLQMQNLNALLSDYSDGVFPPDGIETIGFCYNAFSLENAPFNSIIFIQDPLNSSDTEAAISIFQIDYDAGGSFIFQPSLTVDASYFQVPTMNADKKFMVHGVPGVDGTFTTADAKTVTVSGGIITSIV